jgi:uncharacterized protein YqhQ
MPAEPRPGAREAQRDAALGGQAVLEGVMLRGQSSWAVAVRTPRGEIAVRSFPLETWTRRHPALRRPLLRGIVACAESLWLGARALAVAAAARPRGERARRRWTAAAALTIGAALFLLVPGAIAGLLGGSVLLEGVLRVVLVLAYVALLSRLPGLRRRFAYHGAEHKAVACLEAGSPLTPEAALRCPRLHPRCGTTFLVVLTVVAGLVYAPLGLPAWYLLLASRVLALPLAVGLSFELVRWAAVNPSKPLGRAVVAPGLQLQRLTTREPDRAQLAVALAALEAVLAVEAPARAPARGMKLAA